MEASSGPNAAASDRFGTFGSIAVSSAMHRCIKCYLTFLIKVKTSPHINEAVVNNLKLQVVLSGAKYDICHAYLLHISFLVAKGIR